MTYYALFYGVMTIIGGVIGYLKAGSQMSLIAGGVSGLLILGSAVALLNGKPFGYYGILVLSLALAVFFGMRFFQSFAFMPAGLMLALSLISLIGFIMKKPAFLQAP